MVTASTVIGGNTNIIVTNPTEQTIVMDTNIKDPFAQVLDNHLWLIFWYLSGTDSSTHMNRHFLTFYFFIPH